MKTLGERIKILRKSYKLSQARFAEPLGISYGYISNIENNKEIPSDMIIKSITVHYNTTEEWIRSGRGNMLAAALPLQDMVEKKESEEKDMNKEKMEENLEIGLNENELFEMLGQQIFSRNINIPGREADDLMASAIQYMEETELDQTVILALGDFISDAAAAAGDHAFNMGFREGVRLFRTLMKL